MGPPCVYFLFTQSSVHCRYQPNQSLLTGASWLGSLCRCSVCGLRKQGMAGTTFQFPMLYNRCPKITQQAPSFSQKWKPSSSWLWGCVEQQQLPEEALALSKWSGLTQVHLLSFDSELCVKVEVWRLNPCLPNSDNWEESLCLSIPHRLKSDAISNSIPLTQLLPRAIHTLQLNAANFTYTHACMQAGMQAHL